jgi:hypothetical protein
LHMNHFDQAYAIFLEQMIQRYLENRLQPFYSH